MLLPIELFRRVLELLPPNDQALCGRLACKLAAQLLNQVHHSTARFSQPLPSCFAACDWLQQWREGMRLLTLDGKLRLLSAAASSGSKANLGCAWGLVQPCLFPELLPRTQISTRPFYVKPLGDPSVAAAKAGHAHLLPWLVEHCCPLDPLRTLEAAAQHCDLAGLQIAWRTIVPRLAATADRDRLNLIEGVVEMTGRSLRRGAQAKVAWLLDQAAGEGTVPAPGALRDQILQAVAKGAAAAGNVPLLRWLSWEQGLDLAASIPGGTEDSGYGVLACHGGPQRCGCGVADGRGGVSLAKCGGPGRAGAGVEVCGDQRRCGQAAVAAGAGRASARCSGGSSNVPWAPGRGALPARAVRRGTERGNGVGCGGLWQRAAGVLAAGQGMSHQPGGLSRGSV